MYGAPMTTQTQTIGVAPIGTATGRERWASITHDDNETVVNFYRGWGITETATFAGAPLRQMAESFALEYLNRG